MACLRAWLLNRQDEEKGIHDVCAHQGTEDHTIYTFTVHSIWSSRKPMNWDDRKVTPEMGPLMTRG